MSSSYFPKCQPPLFYSTPTARIPGSVESLLPTGGKTPGDGLPAGILFVLVTFGGSHSRGIPLQAEGTHSDVEPRPAIQHLCASISEAPLLGIED